MRRTRSLRTRKCRTSKRGGMRRKGAKKPTLKIKNFRGTRYVMKLDSKDTPMVNRKTGRIDLYDYRSAINKQGLKKITSMSESNAGKHKTRSRRKNKRSRSTRRR